VSNILHTIYFSCFALHVNVVYYRIMLRNIINSTGTEIYGSKSTTLHIPMRIGEAQSSIVVANTKILDEIFSDRSRIALNDGLGDTI
jgi:hypothetical protein